MMAPKVRRDIPRGELEGEEGLSEGAGVEMSWGGVSSFSIFFSAERGRGGKGSSLGEVSLAGEEVFAGAEFEDTGIAGGVEAVEVDGVAETGVGAGEGVETGVGADSSCSRARRWARFSLRSSRGSIEGLDSLLSVEDFAPSREERRVLGTVEPGLHEGVDGVEGEFEVESEGESVEELGRESDMAGIILGYSIGWVIRYSSRRRI